MIRDCRLNEGQRLLSEKVNASSFIDLCAIANQDQVSVWGLVDQSFNNPGQSLEPTVMHGTGM